MPGFAEGKRHDEDHSHLGFVATHFDTIFAALCELCRFCGGVRQVVTSDCYHPLTAGPGPVLAEWPDPNRHCAAA